MLRMACQIVYADGIETSVKDAFENAFSKARVATTKAKDDIEKTWLAVAGSEKVATPKWFVSHYTEVGPSIGVHRRLEAIMAKLEGYDLARAEMTWTVSLESKQICKVSLWQPPDVTPGVLSGNHRAIYRVRDKDYVLDDVGILTRRFAYCVRQGDGGAPMLKPVPKKSSQRACKFSSGNATWDDAMKAAVAALQNDRSTWHELSREAKVCLAYMNYGNNGKIGVCLSSTPKRIRDNAGEAFLDKEGYTIWRVDLAKIPTSSVLINIYARESKDEQWTANLSGDTRPAEWIAQGTVKNRELFCSNVPATAAASKAATGSLLEADHWNWKTMDAFFQPV